MARGDKPSDADRVVPPDVGMSKMRACLSCSLIKSVQQFVVYGCENCPFLDMDGDRERVSGCTSNAFTGCYVLLKPKESWVAKWQRTRSLQPGAYAIGIDAQMPEDILEGIEENNYRLHRVLATAPKADPDVPDDDE